MAPPPPQGIASDALGEPPKPPHLPPNATANDGGDPPPDLPIPPMNRHNRTNHNPGLEPLTDQEVARSYSVVSLIVVLFAVFTGGGGGRVGGGVKAPATAATVTAAQHPSAAVAALPTIATTATTGSLTGRGAGGANIEPISTAAVPGLQPTTKKTTMKDAAAPVSSDRGASRSSVPDTATATATTHALEQGEGGREKSGTQWWEVWGGRSRDASSSSSAENDSHGSSASKTTTNSMGAEILPNTAGEKTFMEHSLDVSSRFLRWVTEEMYEQSDSTDDEVEPPTPLPPLLTWFPGAEFVMREFWGPQRSKPSSVASARWQRPLSSPVPWTDLLDKVLSSNWRLMAVANLLLALTYLLHVAVIEWFLDSHPRNGRPPPATDSDDTNPFGSGAVPNLIFKMLLVSAIVAPDTLDWMILLTWYTLLTFLRSLSNTCGTRLRRTALAAPPTATAHGPFAVGTTVHPAAAPNPPPPGVMQLLVAVVLSDAAAAAACVGLFHGAGWNMVALLTCDCVVVAVDAVTHLLECALHSLECHHFRHLQEEATIAAAAATLETVPGAQGPHEPQPQPLPPFPRAARLEALEEKHARRTYLLEFTIFVLQVIVHLLASLHFLHLWSLHGFQSSLIDGVLCIQLHTSVSAALRKVQDRRHLGRIARELDGLLENATHEELSKADDVCCICLCSLTSEVKKVSCGHFYHATCLRELVERARSIEAAKCPLCRTPIVSTSRPPRTAAAPAAGGDGAAAPAPDRANPAAAGGPVRAPANRAVGIAERALFRFSTDEVLPEWLPLPAFAFEVVRRPGLANAPNANAPLPPDRGAEGEQPLPHQQGLGRPHRQPSLLRRALEFAGTWAPLTPEQEAAALEQLVDMFPNHERRYLQRELQRLGSAERVANAVLAGGAAGAAGAVVPPAH